MAAKEVVTILGIAATADEWTAWSAVGTVAAALVAVTALLLPLYIGMYRNLLAKANLNFMHNKVLLFSDDALSVMKKAAEAHDTNAMFSLSAYAAVARYRSHVLRQLAVTPNIDVMAAVCAFGAAELLDIIVVSDEHMRDGHPDAAVVNMRLAKILETTVKTDVDSFVDMRGLKRLSAANVDEVSPSSSN